MQVLVTTGAINLAKLQSYHQHQQTNTQFYRPDALPVTQPTVSKHWREKYHIPWTCLTQAHLGVFQLCLWPLTAPGYLGRGLPCLSWALWCQYPEGPGINKPRSGSRRVLLTCDRRSWRKCSRRSATTTWRHRTRTRGNWRKNIVITSRSRPSDSLSVTGSLLRDRF